MQEKKSCPDADCSNLEKSVSSKSNRRSIVINSLVLLFPMFTTTYLGDSEDIKTVIA